MSTHISRRQLLAVAASIPVVGYLTDAAAGAAPIPAAASLPPGASAFASVAPARLADTRPEQNVGGFERLDPNTIRVIVAGRENVPATATAAVLNVTITNTTAASFVTVYPAGNERPLASSVNIERAGQVIPNLVTVRLGTNGAVDIYTQSPADIVVDVNGAYVPVTDAVKAGRFVGLETAFRVLDTRNEGVTVGIGETKRVNVGSVVPPTATAVVVNLTATESSGPGFWTAFAAGGAQPRSSSVNNDAPGQTRANQAILPIGTAGGVRGIDVFASSGGHLVVDVAGYFTGPNDTTSTDGLFVPNVPFRTLDTRLVQKYGRMYPGWIAEFDYSGRALSQAVVVNMTTTETRGPGYFTGYPARTNRPLASNLNATSANQTIANHAILRTSTVGVAVYTQGGGQLIIDVAGYFIGTPTAAVLPAPVNEVPPPPPPAALPYIINMPRLGRSGTVIEGVGSNVVDRGYVGHWPGTGLAGEQNHMVLFAHRTEHGGILRNMHTFGPGDVITLRVPDGRVFRYGYSRRDITNSNAANIYNVGLANPAFLPSVSLVACSKTNYLPTDVNFRLVVTFSLIGIDTP